MRADFSSTIAVFAANAAVSACTARLIHCSRISAGGVVDQRDRVIGEQRIGPAGDLGVMADVVGGIGWCHSGQRVADRDPLIERCEDTEAQPMPQGGLSDQQRGEW